VEVEQAAELLRARSDELKSAEPGRVEVAKVHRIEEVRTVRACREALSPSEAIEIRHVVVELESYLFGVEVAAAPPSTGFKARIRKALSGGLGAAAAQQGHEHEQWQHMTAAAGGAAPLPAPKALLDAAELWLIAHVVEDRTGDDCDTDLLKRPWNDARIVPAQ